jgi:hypothetical protein
MGHKGVPLASICPDLLEASVFGLKKILTPLIKKRCKHRHPAQQKQSMLVWQQVCWTDIGNPLEKLIRTAV